MPARSVTGLVLAGGQGSRMGGIDKGLQTFHGTPLAQNALQRLQQQQGQALAGCLLNANRHLEHYAHWGVPVVPDTLPDYAGPLAGLLSGLTHCTTPWLLTVPCDAPRFPLDLLARLAQALDSTAGDLAVACAPDPAGQLRMQPVFALVPVRLRADLEHWLAEGGRKAGAWLTRHTVVRVPFDQPGDDPLAFSNANTLAELQTLEQGPAQTG